MRITSFLHMFEHYCFQRALNVITDARVNHGGWERWFQVEIALTVIEKGGAIAFNREIQYPNDASICDFCLSSNYRGHFFYELKCIGNIHINLENAQIDAITRFRSDIDKIISIRAIAGNEELAGSALLVYYGTDATLAWHLHRAFEGYTEDGIIPSIYGIKYLPNGLRSRFICTELSTDSQQKALYFIGYSTLPYTG